MHLGTYLYTIFFGSLKGVDQFGNKYYENKIFLRSFNRPQRWVYYKGIHEASKVPPIWYSWLNFQIDNPPHNEPLYNWEKTPKPNLTGTKVAYYPPGHLLARGVRDKATGDYQAWRPK